MHKTTNGKHVDRDGRPVNQKGYRVNERGDVIDAKASLVMFAKSRLDTDGEIPSPHREERFNFNPHDITGNFEKDRSGKPVLQRGSNGDLYD